MRGLPPIDMHAHIKPEIAPSELDALGSLTFAATRTLDEAEQALTRSDRWTVWGVGCHPGLVGAQKAFDATRFAKLIEHTPFVSEVGLDGSSRVPLSTQQETFAAILSVIQATPRIVSVHSYSATEEVLEALSAIPNRGVVLHWWLGTEAQTARAVDLGCYFSVNASMVRRSEILAWLPAGRVLTETDHPFGDRFVRGVRRPGKVDAVEDAIAKQFGLTPTATRQSLWRNFGALVGTAHCGSALPRPVRVTLAGVV
ncbi:TatD family hydrolase [Pimelobacter simplex]|uniref:TatD family hydrolase n=1 Tax=Nocardioides simplex TaxID=2045 RepID=UPI00214FD148|nr:TatD family hydrolase [Pimelobacter simplex]UUW87795.1 TatD family hydrolase [Pimelobacter simplex]UUW97300.1 TatD family hydrolase [Pimelobacter simplex]